HFHRRRRLPRIPRRQDPACSGGTGRTQRMSRDVLFFDLDGTLIDSAVGITRCVAHALEKMGQPVPGDAELRKWIGPALRTSFEPVFGDAQRVEQAVALYRERFDALGWK